MKKTILPKELISLIPKLKNYLDESIIHELLSDLRVKKKSSIEEAFKEAEKLGDECFEKTKNGKSLTDQTFEENPDHVITVLPKELGFLILELEEYLEKKDADKIINAIKANNPSILKSKKAKI